MVYQRGGALRNSDLKWTILLLDSFYSVFLSFLWIGHFRNSSLKIINFDYLFRSCKYEFTLVKLLIFQNSLSISKEYIG